MEQSLDREYAYWIGLTDKKIENQFVWQDSSTPLLWDGKWFDGEPNSSDEDCVQIHVQLGKWGWNDSPCTATEMRGIYFIRALCQKRN